MRHALLQPMFEREIRRCRDCGRPKYQKHAETCPGPPHEPGCGAFGKCDCPAGWKHLPDCPEVVGYPDEAA